MSVATASENVVQWTLSGCYDSTKAILIDAHDPTRSLSKAKANDFILRLACAFDGGSTVCIHAANDILYAILVLAIMVSGCIFTGTSPAYTASELKHHLEKAKARYIITTPDLLRQVEPVVSTLSNEIEVIIFNDLLSDTSPELEVRDSSRTRRSLHDLLKDRAGGSSEQTFRNPPMDTASVLMPTSGTTGLPKLAVRSHTSLLAEAKAIYRGISPNRSETRDLCCLPIYHAFSFPYMVFIALRSGRTSYIMKRFGDSLSYHVRNYKITDIMATPSILSELEASASSDIDIKADLQSIKIVLCSGAALSHRLRANFLQLFRDAPQVVNIWGLTECGWISRTSNNEEHRDSVGKALDGVEVRASVDAASNQVEQQVGELLVRGQQIMSAYEQDVEQTNEVLTTDGWIRTGDVGYLKDGQIFIVDRAKDMIKVDGLSVSPTELESALQDCSKVRDSAALSSGFNSISEHPVIFVVGPSGLSASKIKQHLLGRVSRYKVARCKFYFVDIIPRNESGKILRDRLRLQVRE